MRLAYIFFFTVLIISCESNVIVSRKLTRVKRTFAVYLDSMGRPVGVGLIWPFGRRCCCPGGATPAPGGVTVPPGGDPPTEPSAEVPTTLAAQRERIKSANLIMFRRAPRSGRTSQYGCVCPNTPQVSSRKTAASTSAKSSKSVVSRTASRIKTSPVKSSKATSSKTTVKKASTKKKTCYRYLGRVYCV